jgi:hypothetical protein
LGVVGLALDPEASLLTTLVTAAQQLGETGHAELVDQDSRLIASSEPVHILGPAETPHFTDLSPAAETSYHARFYFHPNNTSTGSTQHDIFQGLNATNSAVLRVQYRRASSALQVRAAAAVAGSSTSYTAWVTIANTPHALEVGWQASKAASLTLWVDGVSAASLAGLDTSALRIDSARLGPSAGLAGGTSGTEYFDGFVSSRSSYIGP